MAGSGENPDTVFDMGQPSCSASHSNHTPTIGPHEDQLRPGYHRLFTVGKSFRITEHDLRGRPICHRGHGSIEAHLTIVSAALAVSRRIETRTGCSIREVRPAA